MVQYEIDSVYELYMRFNYSLFILRNNTLKRVLASRYCLTKNIAFSLYVTFNYMYVFEVCPLF